MFIGRKIRQGSSVQAMMLWVIISLAPALLAHTIYFGWGIVMNVLVATFGALAAEALCLKLRNRVSDMKDLSAIVSGLILGLSLPPQLDIELILIGAVFMIILGKHIYGGLGANPFNPAMLGYAMLLLSFPQQMTEWLSPIAFDYLSMPELIMDKLGMSLVDGYSAATALDDFRTKNDFSIWFSEWRKEHSFVPFIILSSLFGLGGLMLLVLKIISWHIPVSMIAGLLLPALILNLFNPALFPPPWFHLILGATVYGAFFIATDPVSAATSRQARLVYGFGIGLFVFIIRAWGGYADAIAFGVLFFNFIAPFLDKYIQPRIYGH